MPEVYSVLARARARTCRRAPVRLALLSLLLGLFFTATIPAQELRGRVQGIVSDSSGAVIPAATVTLRNVNTNVRYAFR